MMQQIQQTQRGLSVISLMIAMAIGVFLVGGVVTIYVNSSASFRTRNVVSDVTEIQRFALDDMRRIVSMAGRDITGSEEDSPNSRTFPPMVSGGIEDGGATGSDVIAIRYRRGPSCGAYLNIASGVAPATVRFLVSNNQLICELNTVSTVLASNVYALQALYGVDMNDDGFADNYMPASTLNSQAAPSGSSTPWSRVVSIRIGIVAGSLGTLPREAIPAAAGTLNVLDAVFTEPNRTQLFKTASITVNLRNHNPIMQKD